MPDVLLKRGIERVEVDCSRVTTEVLRRTFRVRMVVSMPVIYSAELICVL